MLNKLELKKVIMNPVEVQAVQFTEKLWESLKNHSVVFKGVIISAFENSDKKKAFMLVDDSDLLNSTMVSLGDWIVVSDGTIIKLHTNEDFQRLYSMVGELG